MAATVEQQVLKHMSDTNRPFSLQLLVDALQKFGLKKSQIQNALDRLIDRSEITFKARNPDPVPRTLHNKWSSARACLLHTSCLRVKSHLFQQEFGKSKLYFIKQDPKKSFV
mmetsp:Transcript_31958/g.75930  ORF Transcript_31958/g.75930 Transcript_31958/m.75930 type:complete len:112 (-) Transcript_31958:375-710(-)